MSPIAGQAIGFMAMYTGWAYDNGWLLATGLVLLMLETFTTWNEE